MNLHTFTEIGSLPTPATTPRPVCSIPKCSKPCSLVYPSSLSSNPCPFCQCPSDCQVCVLVFLELVWWFFWKIGCLVFYGFVLWFLRVGKVVYWGCFWRVGVVISDYSFSIIFIVSERNKLNYKLSFIFIYW